MPQLFIGFKNAYDTMRKEVFYNILIEFGVHMNLVSLAKMCLNENRSIVCIRKYLFDFFLQRLCKSLL
jgi:hypothetical protein